jgi:hypothetical protein
MALKYIKSQIVVLNTKINLYLLFFSVKCPKFKVENLSEKVFGGNEVL